jgi:predicted glycosyltransferase
VILYYALGGGLGHLTRARKVLEALGLGERVLLLTASRFARDPRVTGGMPVIAVPRRLGHDRDAFRAWLTGALTELRPDELIVDSFPGGILGELCGMALPPARHVARRLNWLAYAKRLARPLPRYEITYELEPVSHGHALGRTEPLRLPLDPTTGPPLADEPHWLVVHAGPAHELEQLIARAHGAPKLVVVSPRHRDVYPVAPHLPHAERIITAAGFNAIHETAPWRARHTAVPFPRALDDQFAQALLQSFAEPGKVSSRRQPPQPHERRTTSAIGTRWTRSGPGA